MKSDRESRISCNEKDTRRYFEVKKMKAQTPSTLNYFVFIAMIALGLFEQLEAYKTLTSSRDDFLAAKGSVIPSEIYDSHSSRVLFATFQCFLGLLRLAFAASLINGSTRTLNSSFSLYSWICICATHVVESAMWWVLAINVHKAASIDISLITIDINSIILLGIVPLIAGFLIFASVLDLFLQQDNQKSGVNKAYDGKNN